MVFGSIVGMVWYGMVRYGMVTSAIFCVVTLIQRGTCHRDENQTWCVT